MEHNSAAYAIGCRFGINEDEELDLFFVKFKTNDEKLALKLAICVCGPEAADKALVILDKNGKIW